MLKVIHGTAHSGPNEPFLANLQVFPVGLVRGACLVYMTSWRPDNNNFGHFGPKKRLSDPQCITKLKKAL